MKRKLYRHGRARHEITIERRTVKAQVGEATMTTPSGGEVKFTLDQSAPGRFAKTLSTGEPGVHRITMDGLNAIAIAGEMNAPEFQTCRSNR